MKEIAGVGVLAVGTIFFAYALDYSMRSEIVAAQPEIVSQVSTPKGDKRKIEVRVIPLIKPAPTPTPEMLEPEEYAKPLIKSATLEDIKQAEEEHKPRNICERSGGWKVTMPHGYWRCAYKNRR